MKKKLFIIFTLSILILSILFFLNPHIAIDKASGFYDDTVIVTVKASPLFHIRYTLDGSEPTINSSTFEDSIVLVDSSNQPNVYSNRTDLSVLQNKELLQKYSPDDAVESVINYKVEKCNVLRVGLFSLWGQKVAEEQRTYFVDFSKKAGFDDIHIVSITTDPSNLFDYEKGIYVTGKRLDDYINAVEAGEEELTTPPNWQTNYAMDEGDVERPAHVEIFAPNKYSMYSGDVGIKIRGCFTRIFAKKSLALRARTQYGGSDTFNFDIFDNDTNPHTIKLDASDTIDEYIRQSAIKPLEDVASLVYIPCQVFIDGEYWGLYYLSEDCDSSYINDHFGISKDDVVVVKEGEPKEGADTSGREYRQLLGYIETYDMTDSDEYQYVANRIDMDSWINYFSALFQMGRGYDWPQGNYAVFKSNRVSDQPYYDGKWRYIAFDMEGPGCSSEFEEYNALQAAMEQKQYVCSMLRNESINRQVIEQMRYSQENIFSPSNISRLLDATNTHFHEALLTNARRSGIAIENTEASVASEFERLNGYFSARSNRISEQSSIYGLYGYFESNNDVIDRLYEEDILNGDENLFHIVCVSDIKQPLAYQVIGYYGEESETECIIQDFSTEKELIIDTDNLQYMIISVREAGKQAIAYQVEWNADSFM